MRELLSKLGKTQNSTRISQNKSGAIKFAKGKKDTVLPSTETHCRMTEFHT